MARTRKGIHNKEKGTMRKQRSTSEVGKSQLRSSLTPIFRMFTSIKLMERHRVQLRKTPFWLLIEAFIDGRVDSKHTKNHNSDCIEVAKTYVENMEGFQIGKETVVGLRESDIESIFGVVSGDRDIEIPKLSGKPMESAFFKRRLSNVTKLDNKNLREKLDLAIAGNSIDDDEDVARLVCLLLFVNIFFTTTGTSMKWGYVKLVEDIETMVDFAWSKLIKNKLLESVKKNGNKPENISGCTIALQYWLCLHSTICEIKKPDEYPAFLQYNSFELHAALSDRLITFPLPSSSIFPNEIPRHPKLLDWLSKRERRIVIYIENKNEEENAEVAGDMDRSDDEIENDNEEENLENENEGKNEKEEEIFENEKEEAGENEEAGDMENKENEEECEFDQTCFEVGSFYVGESKEREEGVLEKEFERMTKEINLLENEKQEFNKEADLLRELNLELKNEIKILKEKVQVHEGCSEIMKEKEKEIEKLEGVMEKEFERMTKEINLLGNEKQEFKDEADLLRELNLELENEIKILKEKVQVHEGCSEIMKEKEKEIEKLENTIKKLEAENLSLTDIITEMTVKNITQCDLFKPSEVEKEEEDEKEEKKIIRSMVEKEEEDEKQEKKIRSMVRNIKSKSRTKKEDPLFDYPPLKITTKKRTAKFIVKEDDDFEAVPVKKGRKTSPSSAEQKETETIEVDELPTTKLKIKKRWVLNDKKNPVISLLDDADKLKINKMQDHEGHSSIVWSGEDHLSIVSFEDLKAIIKEGEISNMVLDSYIELLTHDQEKRGLDISEKVYIFTSNVLFYLETKENEELKNQHFDSKVAGSLKYKKIVIPLIARSGVEGRTLNHWTVIIVDTKTWTWRHYNSLKPRAKKVDPYFKGAEKFKKAFENVVKRTCGKFVQTKCPQQTSGTVDCGVVVCYVIGQAFGDGNVSEELSIEECQLIRAFLVQQFLYDTGRSWSEEEHLNSLMLKSVPDNQ